MESDMYRAWRLRWRRGPQSRVSCGGRHLFYGDEHDFECAFYVCELVIWSCST